jgi:pseudouridine-5'-phosphate glycosidase
LTKSKYYRFSPEVSKARELKAPLVALETTVVTHGLPYPQNLKLALDMEAEVRKYGAVPATIAVLQGYVWVGINQTQLEDLVNQKDCRKISRRDFTPAISREESGGTTVAGTLIAAHTAGVQVFATGGIGGVHRQPAYDISADLPELARTPLIVVCAGAKAILDLPATLEYLETFGVPVIGYQTDQFPAFYSSNSGLPVSVRCDTPEEVVDLAMTHWDLGMSSALLVAVPPPSEVALPVQDAENAINQALLDAQEQNIHGQAVTPFLLSRVGELTGRVSIKANLGLLLNNARVAAEIAVALSEQAPKAII